VVFGDEEPNREDAIIGVKQKCTVTQRGRLVAAEHAYATRFVQIVHVSLRYTPQSQRFSPDSHNSIVYRRDLLAWAAASR
jgi:hypothetical protein